MKRCTRCGAVKPLTAFTANRRASDGRQPHCRPCWAAYMRAYYHQSPSVKNALRERARKRTELLRVTVFSHYGTTCACCGTSDDLTIDHVNGGGRAHREELTSGGRGGHGGTFYRWLVAVGFPAGYQVLCRRCNASKKEGDRCNLNHEQTVEA